MSARRGLVEVDAGGAVGMGLGADRAGEREIDLGAGFGLGDVRERRLERVERGIGFGIGEIERELDRGHLGGRLGFARSLVPADALIEVAVVGLVRVVIEVSSAAAAGGLWALRLGRVRRIGRLDEGPWRAMDEEAALVELCEDTGELVARASPAEVVGDNGVGGIEEGDVDPFVEAGEGGGAERVADNDLAAIFAAERLDVGFQNLGDGAVALDEGAEGGAAGEGLEADGAGAGEGVEDVGVFEVAAEEIEERLLHAIGDGAGLGVLGWRLELSGAELAGDDAHGEG